MSIVTAGHALELEPVGDDEREWLLDGLALLIRRQGFEHFVTARIVRGRNEDFPDQVPQGPQGARILIRRLLQHAGMPNHRVRLEVYTEQTFSELDHRGVSHAGAEVAAWFAGIDDEVCQFGVNARELRDQEDLIGTLGHEVAHAFRFQYDLVVRDAAVEERLTDVTAVYLGFGIFLLNSSKVFKTGGYSEDGQPLLYRTNERGYLAPRQIALLLAAQVVSRDLTRKQRSAVAAELAPDHRKLFEDACELLPAPAELRQRLGIPAPDAWPEPRDPDSVAAELAPDDEPPVSDESPPPMPRHGHTAQRRDANLGRPLAFAGGMVGLAPGVVSVLDGWPLLATAVLTATVGFVVGARVCRDSCSACRGPLPRGAATCAGCGASIVAEADEQLEDEPFAESVEDVDPHLPLLLAMYAAWAIQREHVGADAEESLADLIVAVRCGGYPTQRLAQAWDELAAHLTEPVAAFIDDYFARPDGPASADYSRLLESGALRDSPACYARVADLLDTRLADWSAAGSRS